MSKILDPATGEPIRLAPELALILYLFVQQDDLPADAKAGLAIDGAFYEVGDLREQIAEAFAPHWALFAELFEPMPVTKDALVAAMHEFAERAGEARH